MLILLVGVGIAHWQFRGFEQVSFDPDSARETLERQQVDRERPEEEVADAFGEASPRPQITRDDDLLTVLILGSDARAGLAGARADAIMLGIIPPDRDPVLVSIPRDLWVDNPCTGGRSRINAGLNGCGSEVSGPDLMTVMVEDLAAIEIDHYVEVDFDGFVSIVETFGGVEICTDNPVRDRSSSLYLPGGCVEASGDEALAWVRSRRTQELVGGTWREKSGVDATTRDERQQDLVLDVASQISRFDSVGSLRSVVNGLQDSVKLDSGMGLTRAVRLAWDHRHLDTSTVERISIPVTGFTTSGGAQVLRADEPLPELLGEALDRDPAELGGSS